jgi:5-methylcytosine-specific restriction endonuclease McrA
MMATPADHFLHPTNRRKLQRRRYGSLAWERTKAVVMPRDNWTCQVLRGEVRRTPADQICGRRANVCDHIIRPEEWDPPNHPDADRPDNCRAACRSCNMVRHNAAYFREKVDAAAACRPRGIPPNSPSGPTISVPVRSTDAEIAAQKALPLIDSPHDHTSRIGIDAHSLLYTGGQAFRVCPRDCPNRSRSIQPSH